MKLIPILVKSFGGDPSGFTDETVITQLPDWDSMSHMLFITQLEEVYEIDLTGDEIADMQKIGDVKKTITSKGVQIL